MLSYKAIYDGKELKFSEKVTVTVPHTVIVTFLEDDATDDITSDAIHKITIQGKAFDFLDNPEEDIYTDNDLKVKY